MTSHGFAGERDELILASLTEREKIGWIRRRLKGSGLLLSERTISSPKPEGERVRFRSPNSK